MNILTQDHGWWRDSRGRRRTEWSAIDLDTYDGSSRSPIGIGDTETEAIVDLKQQMEDGE